MCRRPAVAVLAVLRLLALGAPASAQLGGLIKKVPKVPTPALPAPPSTPSAPSSTSTEPAPILASCDQLKQLIDAFKAERQALEQGAREAAAFRARIAAEDQAGPEAQQERMMGVLEASAAKEQKYKDCLDAAMLKDADNPKLERLEMQAEDELDDDKAAKLSEQADALRKVIKHRAEPACAALKTDMGADMKAFTEAEVARRQSEEQVIENVNTRAEQAGADSAKMVRVDYAKMKEDLCVGIVGSKLNASDRALIDSCGSQLPDALRALGCGSGSPWGAPTPAVK